MRSCPAPGVEQIDVEYVPERPDESPSADSTPAQRQAYLEGRVSGEIPEPGSILTDVELAAVAASESTE